MTGPQEVDRFGLDNGPGAEMRIDAQTCGRSRRPPQRIWTRTGSTDTNFRDGNTDAERLEPHLQAPELGRSFSQDPKRARNWLERGAGPKARGAVATLGAPGADSPGANCEDSQPQHNVLSGRVESGVCGAHQRQAAPGARCSSPTRRGSAD